MNKFILNITVAVSLLVATTVVSAQAVSESHVDVKQTKFALIGDSVYVEMEIALGDARLAPQSSVVITPVLVSDNAQAFQLPSLRIDGNRSYTDYRRSVALNNAPQGLLTVMDANNKKAPRTYNYTAAIPYEKWMRRSKIVIREDQCECTGPLATVSTQVLAGELDNQNLVAVPELYAPKMFVSYITPEAEKVKNRTETGKAYLDFQVGQSTILPTFKNNATELDKIHALVRFVKNDPYATITGMVFEGYASPEGSYAANMTLSQKRATALKNYIKSQYGLNEKIFTVVGKGEDWAGLDTLVSQSGLAYTDQALAIIRGTDVFDGREKKLMMLEKGVPYRDMKENFFTKLRHSDYELKYIVRPVSVEEAKELIGTRPALLSLNEMFLISQTYAAGSEEFNEVFEIAAKMFPESNDANLNAAASAISRGDLTSAARYMKKAKEQNAAYLNNMGLMSAVKGDYAAALEYFVKAKAAGSTEAEANAAEIDKVAANRAAINSAIEANNRW